jgi:segregation and condensation protein B
MIYLLKQKNQAYQVMEHNTEIKKYIESILLFKGQPISYKEISSILEINIDDTKKIIQELAQEYIGKGITVTYNNTEAELVTTAETAEIISKLQKQELETELSNASLETLSIILYMGPITRSMIDFIRGVNSQFTLRSLLIRGLIERDQTSKTPMYTATLDTIKYLGLNRLEELPSFKETRQELNQFIKENSKDGE